MASAGGRAHRALAAALAFGLLASCTGDDGDAGPTTTAERGATAASVEDGGTVRLGLPGEVVADPVEASLASPSDQMVLDLLYDGLTSVDEDGTAQPALAASWTHNVTLTAWEFVIDPDASFVGGAAITAADVVTSIERVAALGDTSLVALALEPVKGFRAFVDGTADHLAGLQAKGDDTVRVELDSALSTLSVVLASPSFGVVDPATPSDPAELDLSGAWAITGEADDGLTLERRDGAPGHLDGIELRVYDDADAAYEAFSDGEVDWAPVPTERFGEAVEDHGDDHFAPFHAELFFGLNLGSDALGNEVLREAIEASIDREAIVEAVYPDLADALATVVPAGVPGHDDERCGACGPDPQHAADLVAFAFPDGGVPTIHLDYDESSAQETMAEMIAGDLEAAGIPTELRPLPLEEYKAFVVSGAQELFTFGWIGAYRSPDAYLAPLFVSDADDNLTAYRSSDVDGLLERARADADEDNQAGRWVGAEEIVMDAAVVIPIAQFRTQVVVADRVQGLVHAVDGTVDWAAVSVSDGD